VKTWRDAISGGEPSYSNKKDSFTPEEGHTLSITFKKKNLGGMKYSLIGRGVYNLTLEESLPSINYRRRERSFS